MTELVPCSGVIEIDMTDVQTGQIRTGQMICRRRAAFRLSYVKRDENGVPYATPMNAPMCATCVSTIRPEDIAAAERFSA